MARPPARPSVPTSLTVSTRRPSRILARIGFSIGSNASSVMVSSVIRTGQSRRRPKASSTSGAGGGTTSRVPAASSAAASCTAAMLG